jgi:DNA-binding NarL/FixJ family response regulator
MTIGSRIRTFLVEDHPLIGEEVGRLLRAYPNIDLVGSAEDGEEAVLKVIALQPAVVVMDINLPKIDGIAATRLIKRKYAHIVVIGLTAAINEYVVYAMLKVGAFDVLAKEKAQDDLYTTIQRAVATSRPILILDAPPVKENTRSLDEECESPAVVHEATTNFDDQS